MRPMLDDLELPQVQDVMTTERRALAEHKAPGMDGSLLQNLGRRPLYVRLRGVASGPEALDFVEQLDALYRAGNPLSFTADIVADAALEQVIIDDIQWQDLAGKPQRYAYVLSLREYIEPVEPEDASLLDEDILQDANDMMNALTAGFEIVERLSAFVDRLTQINQALEHMGADTIVPPGEQGESDG